MAYDEGAGVALLQFLQQPPEGLPLCLGACVGGLTADVQPALVADAYRVGVVVPAVGAREPFRSSRLDLSVPTDHVVVAYAELPALAAMPRIDLRCRRCLVRPHCRTVNDNQCNSPHDCIRNEPLMAVNTVIII